MMHLDTSSRSRAKVRTSMANVLAKIIAIAAGESVGKSQPILHQPNLEKTSKQHETSANVL